MTVVTLVVTKDSVNRYLDSAMVHDVLWAFATAGTGLEHARVSIHADRLDIAVFCMGRTAGEARSAAVALCERACRDSPSLSGWGIRA
jgi:hypothetical protein